MSSMTDINAAFLPSPPFAGLPIIPTEGVGVVVRERDGLGLATVLARKGKQLALAQRVRERFGMDLPQGPHRGASGDIAFAATGPGAWLASHERRGNGFARDLAAALADMASISDQSDGSAVLRLSGPRIRDALGKLVPVDVHPGAFKVGDVANTVAAHMGATLWRLEDDADGSAVFEIAVFRSLADSFWGALSESAAEFGFRVIGR
jgi:sarcosine oxidase subunit gamma